MKYSISIIPKIVFAFIIGGCPGNMLAQSTHFQLSMDTIYDFTLADVAVNGSNEIALILRGGYNAVHTPSPNVNKGFVFNLSSPQAQTAQGYKFTFPTTLGCVVTKSYFFENRLVFSTVVIGPAFPFLGALTSFDMTTGQYWCKKLLNGLFSSQRTSFTTNGQGDVFVANSIDSTFSSVPGFYPQKGMLELHKLTAAGNALWKRGFLTKAAVGGDTLNNRVSEIERASNGDLFITGYLYRSSPWASHQFIMKLDSNGQLLQHRLVSDLAFSKMIVTDDGLYLLDKGYLEHFPHFDIHSPNAALLVKLDHDLNLVWAKKYHAERFKYFTATIRETPAGDLLMAHTTLGGYPVVLTVIDANGNILEQKGYPNYSPRLKIMEDGSYVMASAGTNVDYSGGFTDNVAIIAKTDQQGNMGECATFPTCLEARDTTVGFGTFHIQPHPLLDLEDLVLEVEPASATFSPFCDYPPPPVPTFALPDSLCLGENATTVSDGNRLAQAREWQLTDPDGLESLLQDSFEFRHQFDKLGKYLLRQSVWVLGCRADYERSITVLPPLSVSIAADSLRCPDEPQEMGAVASRPATYTWGGGQAGPLMPLTASGTYTVLATDGVCEASDTASVTVVAGLLGGQPAFVLPPDTTVCDSDLPFLLVPQSAFADVYSLGNDLLPAASFPLEGAGTYTVGMEALGCRFEQVFRLSVDCHADVYMPNSFSPNGDGINDVFLPFGTGFESVELSVFDRWGGLVHKATGPAAVWDGGRAVPGTYIYRLVYDDLLSGKREMLDGDVGVLR